MTREEAVELLKNRKVYVNGKSAEIQAKLFELGWEQENNGWNSRPRTDAPFIFIASDFIFCCSSSMTVFSSSDKMEMTAEELLAIDVVGELKENDVAAAGYGEGEEEVKWIFVVKKGNALRYDEKVSLTIKGQFRDVETLRFNTYCNSQNWVRSATERERQILINALKESSDKRAKPILKEVFNIDTKHECLFKTFDEVLVRNSDYQMWKPDFFSLLSFAEDGTPLYVCIGNTWLQCIPYKNNEYLKGTTAIPED